MKNGILKRFLDDRKGSAYIMASFAIMPIFGMAALAIDYSNKDRMTTELETAAETVALHIAKRVALNPDVDRQQFIDEGKSLMSSLTGTPLIYDKFKIESDTGEVKIIVKSEIDTYFMHLFGHKKLVAQTRTKARFGRLKVDVAIAVDNSGSMGSNISNGSGGSVSKIVAAKKAAKLLVKTAAAAVEDLENSDLKFSIVPWHSHVSLPHSELRTGASENDPVTQGTWAEWIDWDGRSTAHFNYLAPYKAGGDMFYNMDNDGNNGLDDEWDEYRPEQLKALLPLEPGDQEGIDIDALKAVPGINLITRKDVFANADVAFNGCFEHRAGEYRYSFAEPDKLPNGAATGTINWIVDGDGFDGDSMFVPNMAPDERDGWGGRNDYVDDLYGDSDWVSGDSHDYNNLENVESARVFNTPKYAETNSSRWNGGGSPNGSCNTAKVLPMSDDISGIDNENLPSSEQESVGAIAQAIDNMGANGYTDQSIGLEWAMHSMTPWEPLDQGGDFDDTQKILVFMTDGYNQTRNRTQYKNSYMSFQYPRDDHWNEYNSTPSGTQIDHEINEATKRYCDAIHARGIIVPSTPEAAIEATNASQLEAAFEKIGDDIGTIMAKMKFRPLGDRVVVRRIESEAKTAGGIIIPDTAQEKPSEGEVVAVGNGARDDNGKVVALEVSKGERVLFGKWSGTEVKVNGEDLLIMKESDIMGIIG
ncbi:chaperonin 4 [Nymphon striatum]|nr:chaperonin 4 [Nymphon striatum]